MKPLVAGVTSTELQHALGEPLDDDAMDALRRARDDILDTVDANDAILAAMEDIWGKEWRTFDVTVWIVAGLQEPVSSPILIPQGDVDVAAFQAFQQLAKLLIREDPPGGPLVEQGYDRIDAVSALLVQAAADEAGTGRELVDAARDDPVDVKQWRTVDRFDDQWDGEQDLWDWVNQHG